MCLQDLEHVNRECNQLKQSLDTAHKDQDDIIQAAEKEVAEREEYLSTVAHEMECVDFLAAAHKREDDSPGMSPAQHPAMFSDRLTERLPTLMRTAASISPDMLLNHSLDPWSSNAL